MIQCMLIFFKNVLRAVAVILFKQAVVRKNHLKHLLVKVLKNCAVNSTFVGGIKYALIF